MIDAETEYRRQMGEEAYQRQLTLGRLARGACVCDATPTRRRWSDTGEVSTRVVHREGCPKRKPWMERT